MDSHRSIDNIVVIGGGSAGWFTALSAKRAFPKKNITVIESEKYGILGAGEGTTPDIIRLLTSLNIPVSRLIANTDCTFKNGIKFINWNGDGSEDYFFHCFDVLPDQYRWLHYSTDPYICAGTTEFMYGCTKGEKLNEYDFFSKASMQNKVPFYLKENHVDMQGDPIYKYQDVGYYALHFDAAKLAVFLRGIAEERGIKRIEGIVSKYTSDSTGDVKVLVLESGKEVFSDFIFDCSGFRSFFPTSFETEWESYEQYLPTDSALPFFIPIEEGEEIPSVTQAIAMKYGWAWKTPLQSRYGCGYVYDSSYISEEKAREEIYEVFGSELETKYIWPRSGKGSFKFKAGHYKQPWRNNVISIGLSSGFIEPLEATSMWITSTSLGQIFGSPENLYSRDQRVVDDFNNFFCIMSDQILDFIYYHFMTVREDTEFWKYFTKDRAPQGLQRMLNLMEAKYINRDDIIENYWPVSSWLKVGISHRNKNIIENAKRAMEHSPIKNDIEVYNLKIKEDQDRIVSILVTQKELLDSFTNTRRHNV